MNQKVDLTELELLDKAFNASPCLMAISTIPDGCYIKVNKCFEELTGYSAEEAIGRKSGELNIFDEATRLRLLSLYNEKGYLRNIVEKYRAKDGTVRIGLFSADIIYYNGEKCFLTTANDITEQKKLEEEMSKLDRLNLIGQMAASIAHEIRNPMTSVRGFLQFFSDKDELSSYKDSFLLMIDELDRANRIITEFLSISKSNSSEFSDGNINSILLDLEPLIVVSGLISNGTVQFDLEYVPDIPIQKEEIRQLILNLTSNAFESMPNGGVVNVRTYIENQYVVLAIRDQGTGIDTEYMEKLGTPFFTTKNNGTGLGLAVCYNIVQHHSAKMEINSSNTGTEILVYFNV